MATGGGVIVEHGYDAQGNQLPPDLPPEPPQPPGPVPPVRADRHIIAQERQMMERVRKSEVVGVSYGLLSNDEILRRSVTRPTLEDGVTIDENTTQGVVIADNLYEKEFPMHPKALSVLDLRMGPPGMMTKSCAQCKIAQCVCPNVFCKHCGKSSATCMGHWGHVDLGLEVYQPRFVPYLIKTLRCLCFYCGRLVVLSKNFKVKTAVRKTPNGGIERLRAIEDLCKNKRVCPHEDCRMEQPLFKQFYRMGEIAIKYSKTLLNKIEPVEPRFGVVAAGGGGGGGGGVVHMNRDDVGNRMGDLIAQGPASNRTGDDETDDDSDSDNDDDDDGEGNKEKKEFVTTITRRSDKLKFHLLRAGEVREFLIKKARTEDLQLLGFIVTPQQSREQKTNQGKGHLQDEFVFSHPSEMIIKYFPVLPNVHRPTTIAIKPRSNTNANKGGGGGGGGGGSKEKKKKSKKSKTQPPAAAGADDALMVPAGNGNLMAIATGQAKEEEKKRKGKKLTGRDNLLHGQTYQIIDIVKANNELVAALADGKPRHIIDEHLATLQFRVSSWFISDIMARPGVAKQYAYRDNVSVEDLVNGKGGLFRNNIEGKRDDYTGRDVITPDPNLRIFEQAIPLSVAMTLTKPEIVNTYNYNRLTAALKAGRYKYPGCTSVKRQGERELIEVSAENHEALVERGLQYGDIVHRHLIDGDVVIYNRQPSIHKLSINAHRVRVMYKGKSFRHNPTVCFPYNADFDGDEMNLHVSQNILADIEAMELMAIGMHRNPQNQDMALKVIQDGLLGAMLLTQSNDVRFGVDELMQFCMCLNVQDSRYNEAKHGYSVFEAFMKRLNCSREAWLRVRREKQAGRDAHEHNNKCYSVRLESQQQSSLGGGDGDDPMLLDFLNDYEDDDDLEVRQQWTGREIVEMLFPEDLDYYVKAKEEGDEDFVIKNGKYVSGVITKQIVGDKKTSLVAHIDYEYGPYAAICFMEGLQQIAEYYLLNYRGFTISLSDFVTTSDYLNESQRAIKADLKEVQEYVDKETKLILDGKSVKNFSDLERETNNRSNAVRSEAAKRMMTMLNKRNPGFMTNNNLMHCVYAGSKGSIANIEQMWVCVGQQNVEGKRAQPTIRNPGGGWRTLFHYIANDGAVKGCVPVIEGGFVVSCYIMGLGPEQFFFHAMGGREGLTDTAMKTADVGYFQRRLEKQTEDAVVRYDGTVRGFDNRIIVMAYGGTNQGYNFASFITHPLWKIGNVAELADAVLMPQERLAEDWHMVLPSYLDGDAGLSMVFAEEWDRVSRYELAHLAVDWHTVNSLLSEERSQVPLPFDLQNLMDRMRKKLPLSLVSHETLDKMEAHGTSYKVPSDIVRGVETLIQEMERVFPYKVDQVRRDVVQMTSSVLRFFFRTRAVMKWYTPTRFKFLCGLILDEFRRNVVEPGANVGTLAAQSVGAPTTQMTLNTFHNAGDSAVNVTLGVPRIDELTKLSAKKIVPITSRARVAKSVNDGRVLELFFDVDEDRLQRYMLKYEVANPDSLLGRIYHDRKKTQEDFSARSFTLENLISQSRNELLQVRFSDIVDRNKLWCQFKLIENVEDSVEVVEPWIIDSCPDCDASAVGRCRAHVDVRFDDMYQSHIIHDPLYLDAADEQRPPTRVVDDLGLMRLELELNEEQFRGKILSDYVLRYMILRHSLTRYNITLDEIKEQLLQRLGVDSAIVVCANENDTTYEDHLVIRIYMLYRDVATKQAVSRRRGVHQIPIEQQLFHQLSIGTILPTVFKGMENCVAASVQWTQKSGVGSRRRDPEVHLMTNGGSLFDYMDMQGLDHSRLYSNDPIQMYEAYGLMVSRAVQYMELRKVFDSYGIQINLQHIQLVIDNMLRSGTWTPYTYHGLKARKSYTVTQLASFEQATRSLTQSSAFNTQESMQGISANVMTGTSMFSGSGFQFEVVKNRAMARKHGRPPPTNPNYDRMFESLNRLQQDRAMMAVSVQSLANASSNARQGRHRRQTGYTHVWRGGRSLAASSHQDRQRTAALMQPVHASAPSLFDEVMGDVEHENRLESMGLAPTSLVRDGDDGDAPQFPPASPEYHYNPDVSYTAPSSVVSALPDLNKVSLAMVEEPVERKKKTKTTTGTKRKHGQEQQLKKMQQEVLKGKEYDPAAASLASMSHLALLGEDGAGPGALYDPENVYIPEFVVGVPTEEEQPTKKQMTSWHHAIEENEHARRLGLFGGGGGGSHKKAYVKQDVAHNSSIVDESERVMYEPPQMVANQLTRDQNIEMTVSRALASHAKTASVQDANWSFLLRTEQMMEQEKLKNDAKKNLGEETDFGSFFQ